MLITEKKLRSLVSNVISEMSSYTLQAGSSDISMLAQACCDLTSAQLFRLCVEIYMQNYNMGQLCAELCAFAWNGDNEACEKCLHKIFEDESCAQVCSRYLDDGYRVHFSESSDY